MHRNMTRHRVNSSVLLQHLSPLSLCLSHCLSLSLTFTPDKQGQLSGVWLSARFYEHDNLVMCVFRNVSTIDEDNQVSLLEFRLTSARLEDSTESSTRIQTNNVSNIRDTDRTRDRQLL